MAKKETSKREETANVPVQVLEELRKLREEVCLAIESSTKCFNDFVKYTQQQGLQLEVPSVGTVWPLGSATVTLLGPVTQYSETNNTSLVLRIDYGNTSFLLTGDMEKTAETDLVNSGANLKADVLQVGHHGSSTSTGYLFLNAVLPEMGGNILRDLGIREVSPMQSWSKTEAAEEEKPEK